MSNLKKYSNGKSDATKAIQKLLDQRGLVENVYRNERNLETIAPTIRISENVSAENICFKNINETFCKETLTTVENNSDCEYSL